MADSNEVDDILDLDGDKKRMEKANEENSQVVRYFKRVFSTNEGKKVLMQILEDLKYFDPCVTEDDRALSNYAKFLISERLEIRNRKLITDQLIETGIQQS